VQLTTREIVQAIGSLSEREGNRLRGRKTFLSGKVLPSGKRSSRRAVAKANVGTTGSKMACALVSNAVASSVTVPSLTNRCGPLKLNCWLERSLGVKWGTLSRGPKSNKLASARKAARMLRFLRMVIRDVPTPDSGNFGGWKMQDRTRAAFRRLIDDSITIVLHASDLPETA
jgi:hypothetical protein